MYHHVYVSLFFFFCTTMFMFHGFYVPPCLCFIVCFTASLFNCLRSAMSMFYYVYVRACLSDYLCCTMFMFHHVCISCAVSFFHCSYVPLSLSHWTSVPHVCVPSGSCILLFVSDRYVSPCLWFFVILPVSDCLCLSASLLSLCLCFFLRIR